MNLSIRFFLGGAGEWCRDYPFLLSSHCPDFSCLSPILGNRGWQPGTELCAVLDLGTQEAKSRILFRD